MGGENEKSVGNEGRGYCELDAQKIAKTSIRKEGERGGFSADMQNVGCAVQQLSVTGRFLRTAVLHPL
jgi:hypothetical protein